MTWTLCTIAEPVAAVREMRRVLRPGGKLLFIEHGRSDDAQVARWQDRWNPIQNVIGCGCNVNRRIDALVEQGGFRLASLERFLAEGAPRMFGEMYRGTATPGLARVGPRSPASHVSATPPAASSTTRSARAPVRSVPRSRSRPSSTAGRSVAAATASSCVIAPKSSALRTARSSVSRLPARRPSARRSAVPSSTSAPAPKLRPGETRSVISSRRSRLARAASRTASGCTCTPSQIRSQLRRSSASAAPASPGARWWMPLIAFQRCVT